MEGGRGGGRARRELRASIAARGGRGSLRLPQGDPLLRDGKKAQEQRKERWQDKPHRWGGKENSY